MDEKEQQEKHLEIRYAFLAYLIQEGGIVVKKEYFDLAMNGEYGIGMYNFGETLALSAVKMQTVQEKKENEN